MDEARESYNPEIDFELQSNTPEGMTIFLNKIRIKKIEINAIVCYLDMDKNLNEIQNWVKEWKIKNNIS